MHGNEWNNFLERVGVGKSREDEMKLFKDKRLLEELRLWASFRGQTLARTVEGMMLHEKALKLLGSWEGLRDHELHHTCTQKFSYLVSAQAYGNHKRSRDLKAADTEFLLQRYPSLRVAYVDKVTARDTDSDKGGNRLKTTHRFYSVLIKGVQGADGEGANEEIFRVQLPGDIMLGEGKLENQNHAVIFTRGEALQTIDMNQCGYFEEALKMRNLLCEFRAHPDKPQPPTIWASVSTSSRAPRSSSSLASYMALQEGCFVTLTQRVLWDLLQVRYTMAIPTSSTRSSPARGGVSKSSKGINLSEDIYAGFNHLLRGATIPYIEYVQVGKGATSACSRSTSSRPTGNAGSASRAMCTASPAARLPRLLSFYYSGPGFYFNNACTVFAMFVFLYLQLWSHTLQLDVGVLRLTSSRSGCCSSACSSPCPSCAISPSSTASRTRSPSSSRPSSPAHPSSSCSTWAQHYYDGTLKLGTARSAAASSCSTRSSPSSTASMRARTSTTASSCSGGCYC